MPKAVLAHLRERQRGMVDGNFKSCTDVLLNAALLHEMAAFRERRCTDAASKQRCATSNKETCLDVPTFQTIVKQHTRNEQSFFVHPRGSSCEQHAQQVCLEAVYRVQSASD